MNSGSPAGPSLRLGSRPRVGGASLDHVSFCLPEPAERAAEHVGGKNGERLGKLLCSNWCFPEEEKAEASFLSLSPSPPHKKRGQGEGTEYPQLALMEEGF